MTFYAKLILAVVAMAVTIDCADIQAIFNRMTNEDKCGQMTQVTFQAIAKYPPPDPSQNPIDPVKLAEAIKEKRVGSILNTPYDYAARKDIWQQIIKQIQDVAQETELKIPILYGIDSIHGANYIQEATLFPQPLGMASTFNTEIPFKDGGFTAMETRAVGIPWNFNPVLDVGRQPLWPRIWETYGEDTYLGVQMGSNYIRGHQGNDLKNRTFAATCLKHYIGYSFPFNGRDRSVAYIPETLLRETFLPTFAAGVAAGSLSVMINSGDVNGIPGHANGFYINDILKGELNFQGFTVSDWEDIVRLHTRDKVAATPEDAVRIAVMNGLDMSMVPFDYSFYDHCVNLTKKDSAFVARVNDATMRILRVKDGLGLFEDPYPKPADLDKVGSQEAWEFTLEAARESIILAKNDNNILPLSTNARILVSGPTGNLLRVLHGGWSYTWQGNDEATFQTYGRKKHTVFEAVSQSATNAQYVQGANFTHVIDIQAAVDAAQNVDVILLCIGEDTYTETPGNINNLMLSEPQVELANALLGTGKPVVVVYLAGRPRIMTDIGARAKGAVLAFLPGNRGAEAIADVLFGRVNPSGRLPITYPAHPNGYTTYDRLPIEEFDFNSYQYLFPFGHGLSYTTFEYSNLVLSTRDLVAPSSLTVSVTVRNTGNRDGKESILLYLNDAYGSIPRPVRQLKKFSKISLQPGESRTVSFQLTMDDLSFINAQNKRVYEAGDFNVYIGNLNASFVLRVNEATTQRATTQSTVRTTQSTVRADSTPSSAPGQLTINLITIIFTVFFAFIKYF